MSGGRGSRRPQWLEWRGLRNARQSEMNAPRRCTPYEQLSELVALPRQVMTSAGVVAVGILLLLGCHRHPEVRVEDIASRHLAALGSVATLKATSSWRITGTTVMPDGTTWRYISERRRPNLCRWESSGPGGTRLRGYNGKAAWRRQGTGPVEILSGVEAQERIDTCEFDEDPLLDYASRGIAIRNMGLVEVDGTKAYKVETVTKSRNKRIIYIDATNWLDVRWDYVEPDGSVMLQHLSDRRVVGGISTATTWLMTDADGGFPMRSHADTVEIDVRIPDERFDPPSPQ